jgi:hypothetical protein
MVQPSDVITSKAHWQGLDMQGGRTQNLYSYEPDAYFYRTVSMYHSPASDLSQFPFPIR